MHDALPLPQYVNLMQSWCKKLEEICNSTTVGDLQFFQWHKSITQVSMLVVFISSIGYCLTLLQTNTSCGMIAEKLLHLFPFNLPWNSALPSLSSHCGNLQTECSRHIRQTLLQALPPPHMIWVNGSDRNLARLVSIWRSPRLSFQVSESEQRYKSYRSVDYLPLYIT